MPCAIVRMVSFVTIFGGEYKVSAPGSKWETTTLPMVDFHSSSIPSRFLNRSMGKSGQRGEDRTTPAPTRSLWSSGVQMGTSVMEMDSPCLSRGYEQVSSPSTHRREREIHWMFPP